MSNSVFTFRPTQDKLVPFQKRFSKRETTVRKWTFGRSAEAVEEMVNDSTKRKRLSNVSDNGTEEIPPVPEETDYSSDLNSDLLAPPNNDLNSDPIAPPTSDALSKNSHKGTLQSALEPLRRSPRKQPKPLPLTNDVKRTSKKQAADSPNSPLRSSRKVVYQDKLTLTSANKNKKDDEERSGSDEPQTEVRRSPRKKPTMVANSEKSVDNKSMYINKTGEKEKSKETTTNGGEEVTKKNDKNNPQTAGDASRSKYIKHVKGIESPRRSPRMVSRIPVTAEHSKSLREEHINSSRGNAKRQTDEESNDVMSTDSSNQPSCASDVVVRQSTSSPDKCDADEMQSQALRRSPRKRSACIMNSSSKISEPSVNGSQKKFTNDSGKEMTNSGQGDLIDDSEGDGTGSSQEDVELNHGERTDFTKEDGTEESQNGAADDIKNATTDSIKNTDDIEEGQTDDSQAEGTDGTRLEDIQEGETQDSEKSNSMESESEDERVNGGIKEIANKNRTLVDKSYDTGKVNSVSQRKVKSKTKSTPKSNKSGIHSDSDEDSQSVPRSLRQLRSSAKKTEAAKVQNNKKAKISSEKSCTQDSDQETEVEIKISKKSDGVQQNKISTDDTKRQVTATGYVNKMHVSTAIHAVKLSTMQTFECQSEEADDHDQPKETESVEVPDNNFPTTTDPDSQISDSNEDDPSVSKSVNIPTSTEESECVEDHHVLSESQSQGETEKSIEDVFVSSEESEGDGKVKKGNAKNMSVSERCKGNIATENGQSTNNVINDIAASEQLEDSDHNRPPAVKRMKFNDSLPADVSLKLVGQKTTRISQDIQHGEKTSSVLTDIQHRQKRVAVSKHTNSQDEFRKVPNEDGRTQNSVNNTLGKENLEETHCTDHDEMDTDHETEVSIADKGPALQIKSALSDSIISGGLKKKANTVKKKVRILSDDTETFHQDHSIRMYTGQDRSRTSQNVIDLDIALEKVTSIIEDKRASCTNSLEKKALNSMLVFVRKEITNTINRIEDFKYDKRDLTRSRKEVKAMRENLIDLQKEKASLTSQIKSLKKDDNTKRRAVSDWLAGMCQLMKVKPLATSPKKVEYHTYGDFP